MKALDERKLKETMGGFIDVFMVLSFSSLFYQMMKRQPYISIHYWGM